MSAPIEIVSILSIKLGNIDRVYLHTLHHPLYLELQLKQTVNRPPEKNIIQELTSFTESVEANESGVLRYQMYRQIDAAAGTESLIFIKM
jgi:hypothetical protein